MPRRFPHLLALSLTAAVAGAAPQITGRTPAFAPTPARQSAALSPRGANTATYVVFLHEGAAYARNGNTGAGDFSDPTGDAAALLRNLIAPGRRVYVRAGDYIMDDLAPNRPLVMTHDFTLEMEVGCILTVPDGYADAVFLFSDLVNGERLINANVIGGEIAGDAEAANPAWVGVRFSGDAAPFGVTRNSVVGTRISHAAVGLDLVVTDQNEPGSSVGWSATPSMASRCFVARSSSPSARIRRHSTPGPPAAFIATSSRTSSARRIPTAP